MNRDRLAGSITQFKGRLLERWGKLTGDPQTLADGRRDQLAGRIRQQRGLVREMTARELEDFLARNRDWRRLSN